MVADNANVYCGGIDGKFAVYDKTSKTFGSLITNPFGTNAIQSMVLDDSDVYCGANGKFAIYNKLSNTFYGLSRSPFGGTSILSSSISFENIYCGGVEWKICNI